MSSPASEDLQRELLVARALALQAGALLLRHLAAPITPLQKEGGELVTAADRESDAVIRAGLAAAFPDDALFSEESADSPERLRSRRVWIVDPLDGTSNFVAQGDEFCVSIGLAVDGAARLGVIYNPRRGELYAGGAGLGVTINDAPAHASTHAEPGTARVSVSRKELARLEPLMRCGELVAITSMAYKLARVAAGLEDAAVSAKRRKEWGSCGGAALVAAAGGRVSLLDGEPLRFNKVERLQPTGFVAAGAALHPPLLAALRQWAG